MEVVHTLLVVRYWSEVLCCTITTHMTDLEVNSWTWKENNYISFSLKFLESKHNSGKLCCPVTALITIGNE